MKVTIDENGLMKVSAESPLEAYALQKWAQDNLTPAAMATDANDEQPIQLMVSWAVGGYDNEH